jgi:large subunit ribosomal protein L15
MKSNKTSSTKKSAQKKKPEAQKNERPQESNVFGLHTLRAPYGSARLRKLVGRGAGSGHGKTSTRGSKGQTSRSGRDFYPGFEGGQTPFIRRIAKRGFNNIFKKIYQIVNVGELNKIKAQTITLDVLKENNLIKDTKNRVKILGEGEIKKAITIQAHAFSKSALEKIKNSGGTAEVVHV